MQIDWLTVSAQMVNFLVLAWLLKRFLYRPVLDAMGKREARIASRLGEAQQREADAQVEMLAYREKADGLEREREARLAEARAAAERERRDLLESARAEIRTSRERWQQELGREKEDFRNALERELAESAIDVARRVLADLAGAELERETLAMLVRRLESLPGEERKALAAAPQLRLATAFEADAKTLESLGKAIAGVLGAKVELQWVREPELVFGVELTGAEHKLAWSVTGYLRELGDRLRSSIGEAREAG